MVLVFFIVYSQNYKPPSLAFNCVGGKLSTTLLKQLRYIANTYMYMHVYVLASEVYTCMEIICLYSTLANRKKGGVRNPRTPIQ